MSGIIAAKDRSNFSLYSDKNIESAILHLTLQGKTRMELDGLKVHKDTLTLLSGLGYIVVGNSGDDIVTIHW